MDVNASGYAEHLSAADLRVLATAAGIGDETAAKRVAGDPAYIERLLADPRVFDTPG
jgi:hypothetical protein